MKLYLCCIFTVLLVIQGCSSNRSYTSSHICLDVANELNEIATSNVGTISVNMPNDKGTVYFRMNEDKIKVICSSTNFKITKNGLITTTHKQEVYYFQNSEEELSNAQRSGDGFWYSKSSPKEQWFAVFLTTET